MEAFLPFIIFGVIIAIVIGAVVAVHRYEKKRTDTITAIAEELGLTFTPSGDAGLQSRLGKFGLLSQGRARKLWNALVGETDEVRLAIFDYKYTIGTGKHSHTHKQTVAAIESNSLQIPPFSMRPESLFDAVGGMLGFQDIDFDDHPEYSKMFVLKSPEEQAVRDFFDTPILDFFAGKKGISVEAFAGQMIFYRGNRRAKPEELKQLLADAYEVYGLFVDRLERDHTNEA